MSLPEPEFHPARKRRKPDQPVSVFSPNPFEPLANIEPRTDTVDPEQDQPVEKPPPIYVHNVTNINVAIREFRIIEPETFRYTALNNKVKLNFTTIDGYRKAIDYLSKQKAEYHTFQLKGDRAFRVVIRGLHHTSDVDDIKNELKTLGYEPTQILPVLHPVTKNPLPLFFVDLKQSSKNAEIYNVTRLYHAVVKIEPPRPKRSVIQCMKCQEFGHSKNYCMKQEKCVRCEGLHSTTACPKPTSAPPVCTNCRGNHTANYKGCPVHVQLQKAKTLPLNQNVAQRPAPQRMTPKPARILSDSQATYASITANTATADAQSSSQDRVLTQLLGKIDQLLSLIQPLVSALTQILPKLLTQ